jgi:hypothetical protein
VDGFQAGPADLVIEEHIADDVDRDDGLEEVVERAEPPVLYLRIGIG